MQTHQASLITEADEERNKPRVNGYEKEDRPQFNRQARAQRTPQSQWRAVVADSRYTFPVAALATGIRYDQFMKYLNCKIEPRKKNRETMEEFMAYFSEKKAIPKHPIYGYMTEEQYQKLQSLPCGAELDHLKRVIEKQVKAKGKVS